MDSVNVNYTGEVLLPLNVRTGPSSSYGYTSPKTVLKKGDIINITKITNDWYYHDKGGWSFANKATYIKLITNTTPQVTTVPVVTVQEQKLEELVAAPIPNYNTTYQDNVFTEDTNTETGTLNHIRGIHGMPFHHLPSTDMFMSSFNNNSFDYGRKYTERIISKMPILILSPGKPGFLQGYSGSKKTDFLSKVLAGTQGDESDLNDILNVDTADGRYYSFEFAYAEYYNYVNSMCQATAQLMGIANEPLFGTSTCGTYNWSRYSEDKSLKGFFSGSEYVPFYIEAENQISESFSNNTGESMLDSGLNKLSDLGKEADFLLGAGMGTKIDALNADNYEANKQELDKIMGKFGDSSYMMEKLKSGFVTVAAGGQLIFPEIWKDSSFSKSYDITIKLATPYGDDVSIFKNIIVPMYHLMGMVLPQQMGMNGYRTPFLVRGFYKGIFNVDMGIITSMSINKGGEGSWNVNGLPTEMDITINIKDLYEILTMTDGVRDATMFVKNTPMMDFMANMAGISINSPELFRTSKMWLAMKYNSVTNLPLNLWKGFSNTMSNKLMSVFK